METIRPFMYDLNQIPYDNTVQVTNRFKGLDLIECLMNYGQRFVTLYRRQGAIHPQGKKNAKKQNCWKALHIAVKRGEAKDKGEKERYIHLNAKFQRKKGEIRKPSSMIQFSSVAQSCPTLYNPLNCSTPGLPVHHQLPESTQTHVHRVSDAIQPSHPLSSPSPHAANPSQHQSLFQWGNS